jgi:hypothetical protein
VLNFLVILYLSLVSFDLWFNIMWMGNLSGLFFMLGGGLGCWGCYGSGGYKGFLHSGCYFSIFLYISCFECTCL